MTRIKHWRAQRTNLNGLQPLRLLDNAVKPRQLEHALFLPPVRRDHTRNLIPQRLGQLPMLRKIQNHLAEQIRRSENRPKKDQQHRIHRLLLVARVREVVLIPGKYRVRLNLVVCAGSRGPGFPMLLEVAQDDIGSPFPHLANGTARRMEQLGEGPRELGQQSQRLNGGPDLHGKFDEQVRPGIVVATLLAFYRARGQARYHSQAQLGKFDLAPDCIQETELAVKSIFAGLFCCQLSLTVRVLGNPVTKSSVGLLGKRCYKTCCCCDKIISAHICMENVFASTGNTDREIASCFVEV